MQTAAARMQINCSHGAIKCPIKLCCLLAYVERCLQSVYLLCTYILHRPYFKYREQSDLIVELNIGSIIPFYQEIDLPYNA